MKGFLATACCFVICGCSSPKQSSEPSGEPSSKNDNAPATPAAHPSGQDPSTESGPARTMSCVEGACQLALEDGATHRVLRLPWDPNM